MVFSAETVSTIGVVFSLSRTSALAILVGRRMCYSQSHLCIVATNTPSLAAEESVLVGTLNVVHRFIWPVSLI